MELLVEEELHRAGPDVADGAGGLDRGREGAGPLLHVEDRGGGLFDQLLVVALDRAVALADVDHVAVAVGHDLDLHVATTLDQALQVDAVVPEGGASFALGVGVGRRDLVLGGGDAHASAAAAAFGLEQDGVSGALGHLDRLLGVAQDAVAPGDQGQARAPHGLLGRGLLAHQVHDVGRRSDEADAVLFAQGGEDRVFREKAPAWVDRAAAGLAGGLHQAIGPQVALAGTAGAHDHDLASLQVVGVRVGGRGREHRGDTEIVAGPGDADRDLPSVGDKQPVKDRGHGART